MEVGMLRSKPKSQGGRMMRQQLALDAVYAMVKSGFTFFSSVYLDTNMQRFHVPEQVQYAACDTMLFHIEGHAALVCLRLHQQVGEQGPQKINLEARVFVQQMETPHLSQVLHLLRFCEEHGFLRKVPLHYLDEEEEAPHLPLFDGPLDVQYWTDHGNNTYWSDMQMFTSVNVTARVKELADSIVKLKPILRTEDGGRFTEIMASSFAPTYTFPDCADEFWSQFHSNYFRRLAKRTY